MCARVYVHARACVWGWGFNVIIWVKAVCAVGYISKPSKNLSTINIYIKLSNNIYFHPQTYTSTYIYPHLSLPTPTFENFPNLPELPEYIDIHPVLCYIIYASNSTCKTFHRDTLLQPRVPSMLCVVWMPLGIILLFIVVLLIGSTSGRLFSLCQSVHTLFHKVLLLPEVVLISPPQPLYYRISFDSYFWSTSVFLF